LKDQRNTNHERDPMTAPQTGILTLGNPAHAYLEFDLLTATQGAALITAVQAFNGALTTVDGVNLVVGFRPELWRAAHPADTPADLAGFNAPLLGIENFTMPATQHDLALLFSGGEASAVFDAARRAIDALAPLARLADETTGWVYHGNRDLTGFIDGSENPPLTEAAAAALVPLGQPGAAGSVLLLQKWPHDAAKWEALPVAQQEKVIGRTKPDSIELEDKPADSHVASTDQDNFGNIFRCNKSFGSAGEHGTFFVGFAATQKPLARMLESMAGLVSGKRDALTNFSRPTTGAYYFVPAAELIAPPAAQN
jgi:putative iron-dependent peroxidase